MFSFFLGETSLIGLPSSSVPTTSSPSSLVVKSLASSLTLIADNGLIVKPPAIPIAPAL